MDHKGWIDYNNLGRIWGSKWSFGRYYSFDPIIINSRREVSYDDQDEIVNDRAESFNRKSKIDQKCLILGFIEYLESVFGYVNMEFNEL